jgi:signal transduction histidine kinase
MFLFNAVRELLFNSIKHSGVKKATVYLRQHPDGKTVISVTDEGKGFNTNRLDLNDNFSTGYGLFSIRERLRALGGALQIHSDKETGTTCVLILPPSTEEEE